AAYSHR
ncbi:hypothetical protein ECEC1869_4844, partial [Escherichia coli EC1869]